MNGTLSRCPDCGVEMERMTLTAGGHRLRVASDENRDGILGSLGAKRRFDVNSFVRSECGLSRPYADLEE